MNISKNAEIKSLLILGSSGKLGSMLAEKFKQSGFEVVGLDIKEGSNSFLYDFIHADIIDPETPQKLSSRHFDVLVVAVPFDLAETFFRDIIFLSGKDCLVVDFLSEKVLFERLIREADADISHIGVHLLFAPSVTWQGQNVLVSPATITDEKARLFIQQLEKWEVALHYCSAEEHDKLMNVVQVGVHAAVIAYIQFLVNQDVNFELLDAISTPGFPGNVGDGCPNARERSIDLLGDTNEQRLRSGCP